MSRVPTLILSGIAISYILVYKFPMNEYAGKIPEFGERPFSDLDDHPSYHCYFTTTLATAFHQPTLHITGIIHEPDLIPSLSAELQRKKLGGLDDFMHTTFVYGDRRDPSVTPDNAISRYTRSRKESIIGISRPRPLSARELLDQEVNRPNGNSLLEVYIDTKPFRNPEEHPLNAEGAKLLILHGLIRAMMDMPRPMPPAQPSPRWLASVLSRGERQRRQDPLLERKERMVGYFVGQYSDAIKLELGVDPDAIKPTPEMPADAQEEWRLYYAGQGPKPTEAYEKYLASLAERVAKDETGPEEPGLPEA
jgi:hypothetical protein